MAQPLSARRCFEIYGRHVFQHMKSLMDDNPRSNNFIFELKLNCYTELSTVLRKAIEEMDAEQDALEP